jgi:hypothetical protein
MMGTELVPETLIFNQLTQLIAQEDFINLAAICQWPYEEFYIAPLAGS